MQRSTRLVAERDGQPVGIASVGAADDDQPEAAQLFGLWVHPEARGTGVATELVRAGARSAAEDGKRQLLYWVGTDNGRAVAFASGFGFRPTASAGRCAWSPRTTARRSSRWRSRWPATAAASPAGDRPAPDFLRIPTRRG